MSGLTMQQWAANIIAEHDQKTVSAKLLQGEGQRVLFTPFEGETGWLLMHVVRFCWFHKAAYKIACIKPGQECLFPNVDEFHYDWVEKVPDHERVGTNRKHNYLTDYPQVIARFPDCIAVDTGGLSHTQELYPYHINQRIPIVPLKHQGLKVDVCLGVRNRQFLPSKNNGVQMQWIADQLTAAGLSFAVIGASGSGCDLQGQQFISGTYGWDGAIEALQCCQCFIGSDSGAAHAASLANGCPMVVQGVPNTASCTTRNFIGRMQETTSHPVIHIPAEQWDTPQAMLDELWKIVPSETRSPVVTGEQGPLPRPVKQVEQPQKKSKQRKRVKA